MSDKDKIALLNAIDAAKKAVAALTTACEDNNAPPIEHLEVCDIKNALWRMRQRILELPS